jgi:RNA polymerase sigma-70 factor (ECF subfamily)
VSIVFSRAGDQANPVSCGREQFAGLIECQSPVTMAFNPLSVSLLRFPTLESQGDEDPRTESDAHDKALIARIMAGDQRAKDELITKHHSRIIGSLWQMVRDHDWVADLTQESVIRILLGLPSFTGQALFTTWMTQVVKNTALSRLRYEKVRKTNSLDAPASGDEGGDTFGQQFAAAEPHASSRIEQEERKAAIRAALHMIDADQRALIMMCDLQQKSYEQIAHALGCPVGTVKSRLFRARASLAAAFKEVMKGSQEGKSSAGSESRSSESEPGERPSERPGERPSEKASEKSAQAKLAKDRVAEVKPRSPGRTTLPRE